MIFDTVNNVPCTLEPPSPPPCDVTDTTPDTGGDGGGGGGPFTLVLKPALATIEIGKTIQYMAFLIGPDGEQELHNGLVFGSSDQNTASIGAIGGNATGVKNGIVTISVTWQGKMAYAQLTVIESCSAQTVRTVLCLDNSLSSSQSTDSGYGSKLEFAKTLAQNYISSTNFLKDSISIVIFATAGTVLRSNSTNQVQLQNDVSGISSTPLSTDIAVGLHAAIGEAEAIAAPGDKKIVILFTDGENHGVADPATLARNFTSAGGIIIVVGLRSNNGGFELLRSLAPSGLFLNAIPSTMDATVAEFNGLRSYLCSCQPAGDVTVPYPSLNYSGFVNWDVEGVVDLIGKGAEGYALFDLIPGHGLYVDLVGSSAPWIGKMTSKVSYTFTAGQTFKLTYKIGGNQRSSVAGFQSSVKIGSLASASHTPDWKDDLTEHTLEFVGDGSSAAIEFKQDTMPVQSYGNLLDNVRLENVTTGELLLWDSFDNENPTYFGPRCGQGNNPQPGGISGDGYFGYNCYAPPCNLTPPPAQMADPNILPDIEGTPPPPPIYTSTKSATACCEDDPARCETRSATATSLVSQADADSKATEAAGQLAMAALVCGCEVGIGRLINVMAREFWEGIENGGTAPRKVGLAVIGETEEDFWNYLNRETDMIDNTGTPTCVRIEGFWNAYFMWGHDMLHLPLDHADLMYRYPVESDDATFGDPPNGHGLDTTFAIQNLTNGVYDLYVYGHGPDFLDRGIYEVWTGTLVPSSVGYSYGTGQTANDASAFDAAWGEGKQFVKFTSIIIDVDDPDRQELVLKISPDTGRGAFISGFQLIRRS